MDARIILGLDPGSRVMGFGIIQMQVDNDVRLVTAGIWSLQKYQSHILRMRYLYTHVLMLLQQYAPDEVAIESIFHGKNIQSMLKLGRAQGVAIAAALACELPIVEYAPCRVKQAVTGHGNASKAQVAAMVGHLLGLTLPPASLDASDALAVALCHSQQCPCYPTAKVKGWSQFVKTHPQRVVAPL